MTDTVIDFLNGFNAHTLIGMVVIIWYFTKDIRKDIKEETVLIRADIATQSSRIDEQAKRTDTLYQMFIDLLKDQKK